jgi:hypothetical protein
VRSQSLVPQVRRAAQERGIAKLIRDLGTNRNALLSYLTGTCREGTGLLIESRFRELLLREGVPAQQVQP